MSVLFSNKGVKTAIKYLGFLKQCVWVKRKMLGEYLLNSHHGTGFKMTSQTGSLNQRSLDPI